MNKKIKIAVGMSGGVDSSVAAALLKEKGYEVVGLFMDIFDGSLDIRPNGRHTCYGYDKKDDIASAENVCRHLDIPLAVIDMKREFREDVIGYFRDEYLAGRTPNPCVVCNHRIKFGALLEKAGNMGIGFDFFATGHYARIVEDEGRLLLMRPVDLAKDQTYFLYRLTGKQLQRIMFPLGEYTKKDVRDIAGSLGLRTTHLPESQDFISGSDYSPLFTEGEIIPGDIVDERGAVLGRHKGIIHYTVGQRKGLGVVASRPLYVRKIDTVNNRITVGYKETLFSKELIASGINLIGSDRLEFPCRAKVKIRIQHQAADADIYPYEDDKVKVIFDEPQLAITPGQSAVFYQGDIVLGGGVIS
ncbi:MAG: tRNA 2-thiouridine(34) synthase MnmA [Deltaproteobacteria bacterium]|nr:tRNA 2-thiouridine(34) synthase MnmA [Deltaproteobacteria bacterium]